MAVPTEASRLWTTGGAGDGASTFTRDQLAEMFRAMLCGDPTTQGVLSGLAVSGTSSPMTLAVGSACVYGFLYFCTVAGDVTKSTPAVGTTGFRVVLRASWAAQTVRVTVISNTDGVAAIPAVTQTASTTWDITLATGTITTGGVITLTDARDFCTSGPYAAALSVIGRSANTVGVTNEIVAANDGEVLRRSGTSIGFGTLADANMTAGGLTKASIANRTRKFMVPAPVGYNTTDAVAVIGQLNTGLTCPDNKNVVVFGSFRVPEDYVSGMTVKAVVCAINDAGPANIYIQQTAVQGNTSAGLPAATNTWSFAFAGVSVGAAPAMIEGGSMSLTGIAAGDTIGMTFTRNAAHASDTFSGSVGFLGWVVEYTADM